ncbi:hypothetical protein CVT25_013102 [Psilocybe cyanescens]|uniref:XPG-I domain-containing protein n=1 Tax=Psilocybe cyanescens TaxID=93625 RepID=A0A409XHP6_PSICY|nr:hypothetical protein CVT25_013102 [Psilocybe cyanescens]
MGVAGLWELLRPAAKTRSLTELAIKEGFEANPDGKRGFRLGIDASIWFFHAEYGKEGENPVLRTLFFRCATLMHTTFLPIFVFDGPKRPDVKRGKKINKTSHKLIPGMKNIIEAFGFEWRMIQAPGEAEAELAYLNRVGVIDGVLSDDVDNFLFGATTVIRKSALGLLTNISHLFSSSNTLSGNRSNPALNSAGKEDKNHTRVFRIQDLKEHPDVRLTRGGMILIGLMAGGDYHTAGVPRCGKVTAHGLAKCGFGDSLYDAAVNLDREDLAEFITHWRKDLIQEIRTNSKGELGRKQASLANAFPREFPDIDILLSYVKPITSESMGRASNNLQVTWSKEPDLAKLAATCEMYFEWGYKEAIIKRFRTVMWQSIVLRILRRAVLDRHDRQPAERAPPNTPRKKKNGATTPCGTPSRMIAQNFSCLTLETERTYISGSESEDDEDDRLIVKVHNKRTHTSTNGLLEYRVEIAPKQLVRLAEGGIQGLRQPEGQDEWASEPEEDEDEDAGPKKRGKGQPPHPDSHLRLWMPACMVEIVEPGLVQDFKDIEDKKVQKKAEKEAKKGTKPSTAKTTKAPKKTKTKKSVGNSDDEEVDDNHYLSEEPKKKTKKPTAKPREETEDVFSSPMPEKPKKKTVTKPSISSSQIYNYEVPSSLSEDEDELPTYLLFGASTVSKRRDSAINSSDEAEPEIVTSTSKPEVIDLTRKNFSDKVTTSTGGLKSFFPVSKSMNKTTSKSSASTSKASASTSTTCYSSNASGPSTWKGSSGTSSATTDDPLVKSGCGKHSRTTGQKASIDKVSTTKKPFALDPDDSSCGEYDTTSWTKSVAVTGSSITSPSKRKAHTKSWSSSSESDTRDLVKKSPRKKLMHTSSQLACRPMSPSPGRLRSPALWKISNEVIDISTEAESDNDLPGRIRPQTQSRQTFPCAPKAKSKVKMELLLKPSISSNQSSYQKVHTVIPDIIDLT